TCHAARINVVSVGTSSTARSSRCRGRITDHRNVCCGAGIASGIGLLWHLWRRNPKAYRISVAMLALPALKPASHSILHFQYLCKPSKMTSHWLFRYLISARLPVHSRSISHESSLVNFRGSHPFKLTSAHGEIIEPGV